MGGGGDDIDEDDDNIPDLEEVGGPSVEEVD